MMKRYGERFGADFNRWTFLTGTQGGNRRAGQRQLEIERRAGEAGQTRQTRWICSFTPRFLSSWTSTRGCAAFLKPGATAWTGRSVQPRIRRRRAPARTRAVSIHDLPAVNASLNGLSAVFLTAGFVFIKRGNKIAHRNCMIAAFVHLDCFSWLLPDVSRLSRRGVASGADAVSESGMVPPDLPGDSCSRTPFWPSSLCR